MRGGELVGGLLEMPDEGDELFGRVFGFGLGAAMNSSSMRLSAAAYRASRASPSSFLDGKWWKNPPLLAGACRDHGVDARRGKPALEHESLGGIENPFAVCGSVTGHDRSA